MFSLPLPLICVNLRWINFASVASFAFLVQSKSSSIHFALSSSSCSSFWIFNFYLSYLHWLYLNLMALSILKYLGSWLSGPMLWPSFIVLSYFTTWVIFFVFSKFLLSLQLSAVVFFICSGAVAVYTVLLAGTAHLYIVHILPAVLYFLWFVLPFENTLR